MKKVAFCISTLEHPLLTIPVFVVIVMFSYVRLLQALFISLLIIGCICLPLAVKMYLGTKKGTYTNFDISDRKQRKSWYIFAIPLLLVVSIILFLTKQPIKLCYGMLFVFFLLCISQMINLFLKSSLHVSLNIYISFLIASINIYYGVLFLLFTALVAWSRVELNRHTGTEIFVGIIIGMITGVAEYFAVMHF